VPAAEKAIELDRALDQREHLSVPLIVLGQIYQCHCQPELAARCSNEAIEVAGNGRATAAAARVLAFGPNVGGFVRRASNHRYAVLFSESVPVPKLVRKPATTNARL
jgi:hypothetical protein